MLFDKGRFLNMGVHKALENLVDLQAAEEVRFAWILADLLVHMDVMKECINRNTLN